MQMIIDFVLLAASAAAAIYCFVLSARLKRLNDIRSGLGASIASMSVTLDEAKRILEDTRRANIEGETKLRILIDDAERFAPELADLLDALVEAADGAASDIARSREAALEEIRRATGDSGRRADGSRSVRRSGMAA